MDLYWFLCKYINIKSPYKLSSEIFLMIFYLRFFILSFFETKRYGCSSKVGILVCNNEEMTFCTRKTVLFRKYTIILL
jgi:hypothetical protein